MQVTTSHAVDLFINNSIRYSKKLYLPMSRKASAFKNLYEWPRPLCALWNQFWKLTLSD